MALNVVGSNPTTHPILILIYRDIAKSVRHQILILAFRRFESCYPCHFYQAEKTEKTKKFTFMLLSQAIKQNPAALDGSAYTSLATLYAKVPGWPIGFGDKDKAEAYFKKSLAINPDGIDPHFFYGEYLLDRGRHAEAREHLENALKAPARSGRELADNGRRKEVQALLEKLNKETK